MRALLFLSALASVPFVADWLLFDLTVCPRCDGAKELASGRSRRVCPKCRGTGRVKRFGRR